MRPQGLVGPTPTPSASWKNANLKGLAHGAERTLGQQNKGFLWRKGKGFINRGKKI